MLHLYGRNRPPTHITEEGQSTSNVEGQVGGDTIHLQEEGGFGL